MAVFVPPDCGAQGNQGWEVSFLQRVDRVRAEGVLEKPGKSLQVGTTFSNSVTSTHAHTHTHTHARTHARSPNACACRTQDMQNTQHPILCVKTHGMRTHKYT